jgi:hypothetical protein
MLLPANRLFHRDWLARKRPLVSTGTRPRADVGDQRLSGDPIESYPVDHDSGSSHYIAAFA